MTGSIVVCSDWLSIFLRFDIKDDKIQFVTLTEPVAKPLLVGFYQEDDIVRPDNQVIRSDEYIEKVLDVNLPAHLDCLFVFFGYGPTALTIDASGFASPGVVWTMKKLYEEVHAILFSKPLKFIEIDVCFCNMGECSKVIGVKELPGLCYNVGEAFVHLGIKNEDDITWFEYPDGVFLELSTIDRLPKTVHSHSCDSPLVSLQHTFEQNDSFQYIVKKYTR